MTTPQTKPALSRATLSVSGPISDATLQYLFAPDASMCPADPPYHYSDGFIWAFVGGVSLSVLIVILSQL